MDVLYRRQISTAQRMLSTYKTSDKAFEMSLLHAEGYESTHWKFEYWKGVAMAISDIAKSEGYK